MTKGSGDLTVGLVSAGVLLLTGRALSLLFIRVPKLEERLVGTPTVLIHDGEIAEESLRREHVSEEQLLAALRQHGLNAPAQAKIAVLEIDGSISIIPRSRNNPPPPHSH